METRPMTAIVSFRQLSRVLGVAALCVGERVSSAEDKPTAHHEHAAGSGCVRWMSMPIGPACICSPASSPKAPSALLCFTGIPRMATRPGRCQHESMQGSRRPFSLHRGMDAQLAAAGDRVVAIWTTDGTDQWGSGPMATALSDDGGKTWRSGPNPADDGSTTGHGFIDIAADPAGTFHLTWLDSRDGKQGLRYARSEDGGKSWSANVTAKAATCECCSNVIVASAPGEVAILFRDGNPRDMRLVRSRDRGQHWLPPTTAGGFDWQFNGCPHVGGGLALVGNGASAVFHALTWTGKSDRTGVYHVALANGDQPASEPKQLGDPTASHPDLAVDAQGRLAAVWDSRAGETPGIWGATSADAGKSWGVPRRLSAEEAAATHPRIVAMRSGFRAFWTQECAGKPTIWATALLP